MEYVSEDYLNVIEEGVKDTIRTKASDLGKRISKMTGFSKKQRGNVRGAKKRLAKQKENLKNLKSAGDKAGAEAQKTFMKGNKKIIRDVRARQIGTVGAGAATVGGAAYGGKKLYDKRKENKQKMDETKKNLKKKAA